MTKAVWLVCSKCGKTDKTDKTVIPHHVGTKTVMRCQSCADDKGFASLCRNCCPSGHGTRWEI